ncbi:TraM recognition domain-containing protein [Microbacterium esteraromaticum]|uniref:type IV secretory system conjugative DNA transfer family protein n=1 Tax=Microbacterium esteraromaticum TaxID=57043 RepID=UPI002368E435|nr:TraM recognition domain-containing protein [Microbacterium esteraromaticum]WDH78251.1 TraM recognition domain-containing protein [Microbacterium esteraromaticum]
MSIFNKARPAAKPVPARAPETPTPYLGLVDGARVPTAPHGMVVGKTGSGKTRRVLAVGALAHKGSRVLVSSKADFLELTLNRGLSAAGPVYVLDLAAELDESAPWLANARYTKVVADPTTLLTGDDDASRMATLLLQTAALGTSSGSNGGGSGDNAIWEQLAHQPLAALLLAGQASGGGIEWVTRAAGKFANEGDDTSPSWQQAFNLIFGKSFHAQDLLTVIRSDEKLRDSVAATVRSALKAWTLQSVRGGAESTAFTPVLLQGPGTPTLFILSGSTGPQVSAAVAVVEGVIDHWRRNLGRQLPWLLISIDELTNTCSIPADLLVSHITELRGLRVSMVLGVQSTGGQLELKYGVAGAKALRETVPAFLILKGSGEWEKLEDASKFLGEEDRRRETSDRDGNVVSVSLERFPRRAPHELLPPDKEHARLILSAGETLLVEIPDISGIPERGGAGD